MVLVQRRVTSVAFAKHADQHLRAVDGSADHMVKCANRN
jgi:hypothetical protein